VADLHRWASSGQPVYERRRGDGIADNVTAERIMVPWRAWWCPTAGGRYYRHGGMNSGRMAYSAQAVLTLLERVWQNGRRRVHLLITASQATARRLQRAAHHAAAKSITLRWHQHSLRAALRGALACLTRASPAFALHALAFSRVSRCGISPHRCEYRAAHLLRKSNIGRITAYQNEKMKRTSDDPVSVVMSGGNGGRDVDTGRCLFRLMGQT